MSINRIDRLFAGEAPVMIVDDEIEISKALARDLRRHGIIETFSNPLDALVALEEKNYSVILSDLKMPEMSGIEFLERAEKIRPDTQRILITAFADLLTAHETINKAKIHRLMAKPWESSDLHAAVEQSLRSYEILRENAELRRLALTDGLTGISNHRYFWERLESEFSRAKRYGRPLSLIMSDVDDFKKYNDTYGHQKGDEILKIVAQTLEGNRRSMDTVARYGGEEFVVILPETTRPLALDIARRHLENIKLKSGIGISLGVAAYPDDAKSSTELVHAADRALLKAKSSGKGRVVSILEV